MSLLDYHGKNLLPTVWSPDGDLTLRFRAQLDDQLRHRFVEVRDVLLVGDAVSHYWDWESDVDVLLMLDNQDLAEAQHQTKRASGYPLIETENHVYFWPLKATVAPEVLAKHFGSIYSVPTGLWYGKHVQDEMELRRVAGILQHANWRLFKAKHSDDPYPYDWHILTEGFHQLHPQDREKVIDEVRYRVAQIDRNVTKLLKSQSRDIWKAAEKFDQELTETEEISLDIERIPRRVALAILHRFRYEDLLDTLVNIDDKLVQRKQYAMRSAAPAQQKETPSITTLRNRLLQISDMMMQQQGGSARAVESMYAQLQHLLENSRYVLTDMRRRRVAYRIYRRYYLGKLEE